MGGMITAGRSGARCQGLTLLELMIVIAIVAVLIFIALPTLKPTEEEATIDYAKEQLTYLYNQEQQYYGVHGTYAPLSKIAADELIGPGFDQRFAEDRSVVNEIIFEGPDYENIIFEITATLPDNDMYRIDHTGEIKRISAVE